MNANEKKAIKATEQPAIVVSSEKGLWACGGGSSAGLNHQRHAHTHV